VGRAGDRGEGKVVETTLAHARRLVVTKQHLAGPRPRASADEAILSVVRDLCYVQWDPISVVAPAHVLALWNRLDRFRPADLDRLLWTERRLFEYCAHAASIVLTEDYPLYRSLMRRYPESLSSGWGAWRRHARRWIPAHARLRRRVLGQLRSGPLRVDQFADHRRSGKDAGGWGSASDVAAMLFHLQMSGDVMVVGHEGNQNLWGLSREFLPATVDTTSLDAREVERRSAQRALRALGLATPSEIRFYFVRGHYHRLQETLAELRDEGAILRVRVPELGPRDERYVHRDDVGLLDSRGTDPGEPRVSLLPPLDNLTCGRERTRKLFGFDHVVELYVPEAKRRFGYYVLPILYGETFVGRLDPRLDRSNRRLVVHAVHAEPRATRLPGLGPRIREAVDRLADFLGASKVTFPSRVPPAWSSALR
jgi:uncharacterized protein